MVKDYCVSITMHRTVSVEVFPNDPKDDTENIGSKIDSALREEMKLFNQKGWSVDEEEFIEDD